MELSYKDDIKTKLERNIISWYPFEQNAKILEIKRQLGKIGKEQYDYIILLGTLEYAYQLFPNTNSEYQLLEYVKKHLKNNGKILIAMDNKMGVKNYCEITQDQKEKRKLSRKQIEELLNKSDFKYYKFYYPLPNYEITNVIFTDDFLPNQETIVRNIPLHKNEDFLFKSENEIFLNLLEQDKELFKQFANSYFIECSRQKFVDNEIKFVSFSNMRKQKYSIKTIIQGDKVYKTEGNKQAKEHIEMVKQNINLLEKLGFSSLDSYEEDVIVSQYQRQESLDNILIKKLKEGKKEEAIQLIIQFFQEIKEKLIVYETTKNIFDVFEIKYEKDQIENLTFTQYGLWDLIFQNAFYIDGKFFFYDQEWIEEGIPIEYIFYRSIQYTQGFKENIEVEKVFNQFGITKKHVSLFVQLDNKLQEKTRNNEVWTEHMQGETLEKLKEQIKKEKQEREKVLEDCKKLLNQKDARICFLEENIDNTVKLLQQKENEVVQKENRIIQMENSVSWKITKPLRAIKKKKLPK